MKIVPDIRFKGFEDEWKLSELGRLFIERIENNPNAEMLSVTINDGIIKASENGRFDNSNSNKSKYKSVKKGDIAYNSMRMWQGASGVSNFEGIVSPAYTVLCPVSGVNSVFFSYLFKTIDTIKKFRLHSQGMTKDTWNLKYPALSKIAVEYPLEECQQLQVASYLQNIDLQISKLVKRIVKLRQLKSACLISMFPQQGETVPRIRFKGFNGEWKKKKLNSFSSRITRKNSKLETKLPVTISALNGIIEQTMFFNNIVASSNLSGYYLMKKGEFAYNKSYSCGFPFGAVKRMDRYEMGALSNLYIVFKLEDTVCDDYILYLFETSTWHKEVSMRASEGARNHGLLNIGAEDFLDIDIWVPNDKAEQHQIASYFRNLDIQISEQEKRLEKLKQIKAACLDKMFV
ncbi:MAG: hypothetical protein SPF70_00410 [Lachnospiraceae bacterium]|nr:hypothetical protein [Lachnospiraceae bacterium]